MPRTNFERTSPTIYPASKDHNDSPHRWTEQSSLPYSYWLCLNGNRQHGEMNYRWTTDELQMNYRWTRAIHTLHSLCLIHSPTTSSNNMDIHHIHSATLQPCNFKKVFQPHSPFFLKKVFQPHSFFEKKSFSTPHSLFFVLLTLQFSSIIIM